MKINAEKHMNWRARIVHGVQYVQQNTYDVWKSLSKTKCYRAFCGDCAQFYKTRTCGICRDVHKEI